MNGSRLGRGGTELQQRSLWRWWGLCLIIGGVVLLALAGAYYGYIRYSDARYGPLTSTSPPPVQDSGIPPALPTQMPTPTATLSATPSPTSSASATASAPTPTPQPTDTPLPMPPVVRIVIPAIDLDAPVVEVNWSEVANHAVGHYPSANPGQTGNIVLAGHLRSDLLNEGDIFNRLPEIGKYIGITTYVPNDVLKTTPSAPQDVYITLYNSEGVAFRYQATDALIIDPLQPDSTWILDPTPDQTLTLITCIPQFVYDRRFVVIAKPVQ